MQHHMLVTYVFPGKSVCRHVAAADDPGAELREKALNKLSAKEGSREGRDQESLHSRTKE